MRANYLIAEESKKRLDSLAAHSGVSASVFLEQLVEHVELNDRGFPVWWEEQPQLGDGELPIDSR